MTIWVESGSDAVKSSEKDKRMKFAALSPPASDISTSFCPPGPTSSTSMSSGTAWEMLVRITLMLVMTPGRLATVMDDG